MYQPYNPLEPFDRIIRRTVKLPDGCWLWTGYRQPIGYGVIGVGSRRDGTKHTELVHRVMWEKYHGPIPDGMVVCHTCDVRACVNPAHLWLGTQSDNVNDMIEKGRKVVNYGYEHHNQRIGHQQAAEIKEMYASGRFSQTEIAQRYGVSQHTISKIVNGKHWTEHH